MRNFRRVALSTCIMIGAFAVSAVMAQTPGKGDLRVPPGFKAKPGTVAEPGGTGWAKEIIHEKTGIEMVFIPAGEFMMGSPAGEKDRAENEGPVHRVRITKPFYMGKYEATQGEWEKVMGNNPSLFGGIGGRARLPVEGVSWDDCQGFCRKAGDGLRLPTEAEWEYACRAGTRTAYQWGDNPDDGKGWCNAADQTLTGGQSLKSVRIFNWADGFEFTAPVGSFKANARGLHDMHGNVWEWCSDWHGEKYYGESPANDPQGPKDGVSRVVRGGSFGSTPEGCRSAYRSSGPPGYRGGVGFRLALDLK